MLANNLANAATAGYKSDREFYSLYVAPEALEPALAGFSAAPATLPVIQSHWTDFNQGTLTPTGNPLDLALSGKGFFVADSRPALANSAGTTSAPWTPKPRPTRPAASRSIKASWKAPTSAPPSLPSA